MSQGRRKHNPAFKAKVALEALNEVEPIIWTGSGRSYVRIPALLPVIRSPLPVNPSFH